MIKKIFYNTIILTSLSPLVIYPININTTMAHLLTQVKEVQRAWNEARVRIGMLKKASPTLYESVKKTLDKVIAHEDFTNKMNETTNDQLNTIVNGSFFKDVKKNISINDYFPDIKMHQYGKNLFSGMADKAYYAALGQKLVDKLKELKNESKTK